MVSQVGLLSLLWLIAPISGFALIATGIVLKYFRKSNVLYGVFIGLGAAPVIVWLGALLFLYLAFSGGPL
jgi:hypothetical protein